MDQRELLDTTDALLMDATNKMDDTAFLDEVIARRSKKVPNSGLGPKWDQSSNLAPKESRFCLGKASKKNS